MIPGFIGAYPNAFYVVDENALSDFVDKISSLSSEEDYGNLLDSYGIRRTDPEFWRKSDFFHSAYLQGSPLTAGLLDYSRLENR